jgi:hypothetical protein
MPNQHDPWRPLFVRENEAAIEKYDALHDGVPEWLYPSLWEWIVYEVTVPRKSVGGRTLDASRLRAIERSLRFSIGWDGGHGSEGLDALQWNFKHEGPDLMLKVVDYLLSQKNPSLESSRIKGLDNLLTEAGSAFRVAEGTPPMLVRRVDKTVEEASRLVTGKDDTSGTLLALAWRKAYGLSPNPSEAYRLAVRAVEAAATPVVLPKDANATLGKVIASLREGGSKWQVSLTHRTDPQRPVDALVSMMALLWEGQYDRHVNDDMPLQVTQAEAETALHLAVTLVQWFSADRVSRRR